MDYARAIKAINKDAEFIINDSDLDNINWLNDTTPISKSNIQNKFRDNYSLSIIIKIKKQICIQSL